LGHTEYGLSNTEIDKFFHEAGIIDKHGPDTKWKRLYHNFINHQKFQGSNGKIVQFIQSALSPARNLNKKDRHLLFVNELNKALSFEGYYVSESGKINRASTKTTTISEAEARAKELSQRLITRDIHSRVLYYCKAELLAEDYFHATHEAVKGVFSRIRDMTFIEEDGHKLIDATLLSQTNNTPPVLIINSYQSLSHIAEQKGFATLLKGMYGMFRNPTAHEVRTKWTMTKEDAEDILSMVSLVHRRLDKSQKIR